MAPVPPARSRRRRRRHRKLKLLKRLSLKFLAFLFSHVGVTAMSIAYMVMGAVIFQYIESPHESENRRNMEDGRQTLEDDLWISIRDKHIAIDRNVLMQELFTRCTKHKFYTINLIRSGYDGRPQLDNIQWSYPGAFFYSLTTISTVGYGNIACRTTMGRAVTIVYAIFGIPLMLLFLAITGDTFSITCKFLYRAYLRQRIRFIRWRHRKHHETQINSALSEMIREQLYHTVAMYGISTPEPEIDPKLLAEGNRDVKSVSVPIYILITLMIAYLMAGATLFYCWESWTFGEAFYFCFVSLALIGLGDLFPGGTVSESWAARTRIIICAFYLLFGMALIAMAFNLAQEDAIRLFRRIARKLGICGDGDRKDSKDQDQDQAEMIGDEGPNEIQPLTMGDLQTGPLSKQPLVIPVYYGSTGKTIRRQITRIREQDSSQATLSNGSVSIMSNGSSKTGRGNQRQESIRRYVTITRHGYVSESRRSF